MLQALSVGVSFVVLVCLSFCLLGSTLLTLDGVSLSSVFGIFFLLKSVEK
jgi:hypothetical protein